MQRIRRIAAAVLATTALAAGTAAMTTSPAAAATDTRAESIGTQGYWYCGYDNREIPPTISYGSTGNAVREAQCLLEDVYGISVGAGGWDGIFGSDTREAVELFQSWYDVPGGADGIVGPDTWDALRNS